MRICVGGETFDVTDDAIQGAHRGNNLLRVGRYVVEVTHWTRDPARPIRMTVLAPCPLVASIPCARRLWLLRREEGSSIHADECAEMLVREDSEAEARATARRMRGDEDPSAWDDATCEEVTEIGLPGVIVRAYAS